ncbi:hypothetical protein [Candidatus Nesciobacter abundans]|uniref:Type II/III secretion system secretin-like domain-containing protein n=1 Tax=Candidatus Nesciobacter abundans TaxID=2601668 RepID=A0A5C0UHY4_9PROT|nr:hypothetical protein [Candidatus Nesciobacter abundans]QEK38982.1 hypothetical protein FZC36_00840 [Candidatus Nesciobacter abundans]
MTEIKNREQFRYKYKYILDRVLVFLSVFLLGCDEKNFNAKPISFLNRNALKEVKSKYKHKSLEVPKNWSKKISINISNGSSVLDIIKSIGVSNGLNIKFAKDLKDKELNYFCKEKPVLEAIKDISESSGFIIRVSNHGILIDSDEPYDHVHEVMFLSSTRKSNSSTSVNGSGSKGSMSMDIGSSVEVRSESISDTWKELEENLSFFLRSKKYTINKQAGLMIVNAKQSDHRRIARFLLDLHKRISTQVLIEAKVIFVKLYKEFRTGIDWSTLQISNFFTSPDKVFDISSKSVADNALSVLIGKDSQTASSIISLLEKYGELETISNPTTSVLNNQHAIFKVAENKVYFKIYQKTISIGGKSIDGVSTIFGSNLHTVPVGTILSVQPSVDFRNRTITMSIHPTISEVHDEKEDPSVAIMLKDNKVPDNIKSQVPVISTQEMDSTIRVNDGDLVVVGGLIKSSRSNNSSGPLGTKKLKFLRKNEKKSDQQEVVIMIKATILDPPENLLVRSLADYEIFPIKS